MKPAVLLDSLLQCAGADRRIADLIEKGDYLLGYRQRDDLLRDTRRPLIGD